jgi:hypothetical protein
MDAHHMNGVLRGSTTKLATGAQFLRARIGEHWTPACAKTRQDDG